MTACSRRQPGYTATTTCDECPWRKDVPVGKFAPERFEALARTVEQGFNSIFACHKSHDAAPYACVGYLMTEGNQNFTVRLDAIKGYFDPEALKATGPLYGSFREMYLANARPQRRGRG